MPAASLQQGLERLLGTIAGGDRGPARIIAFIDLPYSSLRPSA
jgi:hypothetical protein